MAKHGKKRKKKKHISHPQPVPVKGSSRPAIFNPTLLAIAMLVILLLIFFNDVMFSNRSFQPPDGLASKSFETFKNDALEKGTYPLWNPYIFSGMPSFASLSTAMYVDITGTLIDLIYKFIKLIFPLSPFFRILCNYILFGSFIFLLFRSNKLSIPIALFGGLAMIFIPQTIAFTAFNHNTKLATVLFAPVLFLLLNRLLKEKNLLYFSLFALTVGLQLLRKHIQIIYYTQMMIGIYALYWTILSIKDKVRAGKIIHGLSLVVGALILGALLSSVVSMSVYEYADYSIRGGSAAGGVDYSYATNWSFSPAEILTFINPSFMGFNHNTYWGPMPWTDFPQYFSIIIFILAGCALVCNRNRITWFFTILAGFTLIASFGRHLPVLYGPMYKFLPMFNKFRAPVMILTFFHLSMVVLAGFGIQGIQKVINEQKNKFKALKNYLFIFGGVIALLLMLLLVNKTGYLAWASKLGQNANEAYSKALKDGFRAFMLGGATIGFILLALYRQIKPKWLPAAFICLLLIDVWGVDKRFAKPGTNASEQSYFAETSDVKYLEKQPGYFRILPIMDQHGNNWYMYHRLQSVWGYQGAKMKIYQNYMDALNIPNGPGTERGFILNYIKFENGKPALKTEDELSMRELAPSHNFMKLLNVRYVLCPYPLPDPSFKLVHAPRQSRQNGVYLFTEALPRVFFPKEVVHVKSGETMLHYIVDPAFNPSMTAAVEETPPFDIQASDSNRAEIVEYGIQNIKIKAEIKKPALMVLSEMYYPAGWKAYVDNKEVKIWKADYLLRSLFLKPGHHDIKFVFKPKTFKIGLLTSICTLILLMSGVVVGILRNKKRDQQET